jgi:hypothetical protein
MKSRLPILLKILALIVCPVTIDRFPREPVPVKNFGLPYSWPARNTKARKDNISDGTAYANSSIPVER